MLGSDNEREKTEPEESLLIEPLASVGDVEEFIWQYMHARGSAQSGRFGLPSGPILLLAVNKNNYHFRLGLKQESNLLKYQSLSYNKPLPLYLQLFSRLKNPLTPRKMKNN